jgi:hypothetical protein
MATPRQLSDAVKADYDRIVAANTTDAASTARWNLTRQIAGWLVVGPSAFVILLLLGAVGLQSLVLGAMFFVLTPFAPFIVFPAAIVWFIGVLAADSVHKRSREWMFTEYGITVDQSVTPPVYSVSGLPVTWLKPELTETRRLLVEPRPEPEDVLVPAAEASEPAAADTK